MLHYSYKTAIFTFALFLTGMALQSCHHSENADDQKEQKFQVTDSLLNSLLIDTVKQASALSEINLTGSIAPDETKTVKIFPMVSGVAQDVHVQLGDIVSKGQTLAIMKSPPSKIFCTQRGSSNVKVNGRAKSNPAPGGRSGGGGGGGGGSVGWKTSDIESSLAPTPGKKSETGQLLR